MIRTILDLYIFVLILDAILSYFPRFNVEKWRKLIKQFADYSCEPIRKKLPPMHLPVDISPIIVIFLIRLLHFFW